MTSINASWLSVLVFHLSSDPRTARRFSFRFPIDLEVENRPHVKALYLFTDVRCHLYSRMARRKTVAA